MTTFDILQIVLAGTIPTAVLGVIATRLLSGKGVGVRSIQFMAVAAIVPGILLLAIRGLLEGEAVAAILGSTVGYLLSSIAKFDERGDG
jgi:hypothetical protein